MNPISQPQIRTESIHPLTRIGSAELTVAHLERSVQFYTQVIGLRELSRSGSVVTLGTGTTPLLVLHEESGAKPQPRRSTGLYHIAILVPSREDLGRVLWNLARHNVQLGGGDHYVSEAIYLNDMDGNGLEIYRDRPRSEWTWNGTQINMGTVALDFDGILAAAPDPNAPFTGLPDGTTIGHMHLKVGDIPRAQAFYHDVLGFDIVAELPSALFVSAGGYHHHIGMNTWNSQNAARAPEGSVGLRLFTILVADATALADIAARLTAHKVEFQPGNDSLSVADPWGNAIEIRVG